MEGSTTTGIALCLFVLLPLCDAQAKDFWLAEGKEELKRALANQPNYGKAKNVIMFLGDGMGLPTIAAMRIYQGQLRGQTGEENLLEFEKFPHVALSKTYNTDRQVSDSAGTATAYLGGVKTKYGVVGVDDTVERADCSTYSSKADVKSIIALAQAEGKSTGIVTNTRITHATPSAAYAHSPDRNWEFTVKPGHEKCKDIAVQLIENAKDVEVIFGGGRRAFYPNTEHDPEYSNKNGSRLDGRNLIKEWKDDKVARNLNHAYVWEKTGFDALDTSKVDRVLGLFDHSHMQYESDRKTKDGKGEPSLTEMTRKAIKILERNKKGYVLFVEGGRIDHGHHDGMAKYAITDGLQFDDAVKAAVEDTKPVEKETLIVVTADHSHVMTINGYPSRGNPIFDVNDRDFDDNGIPFTTLLYTNGPGYDVNNKTGKRVDPRTKQTDALDYTQHTAVDLWEETHGGEDVSIYAQGPMAHLFHGVHEQNYIATAILYAACIGDNKDHCIYPAKPLCPGDLTGKASTNRPQFAAFVIALTYVMLLYVF